VSGKDPQAGHLHSDAATSLRERMGRRRRAMIGIFVLGVLFFTLLVGWFRRGAETRDLKSANRMLNGKLQLSEFEKRGLRETVGLLVARAYIEFPEEETTSALKTIAARWASKDAMTRRISSALGAVEITIASDLRVDKDGTKGKGDLSFCRASDTLLVLSSDSFCARRSKGGNVEYGGVFQMSPQDLATVTPLDLLRKTEYLTIGFDPRPGDHQVTSGKLTIIFNTSEKFEFKIPSQKVQENKVFVRGIRNLVQSQIQSTNQATIYSGDNGVIYEAPTMEEIEKTMAGYLQYASSAEVRGPLSIEQVEEEMLLSAMESYVVEGIRQDIPTDQFGLMDSGWQRFKSQLIGIDKIYYFMSDKESWSVLCGSAGYAIVREGKVVDTYITSGN